MLEIESENVQAWLMCFKVGKIIQWQRTLWKTQRDFYLEPTLYRHDPAKRLKGMKYNKSQLLISVQVSNKAATTKSRWTWPRWRSKVFSRYGFWTCYCRTSSAWSKTCSYKMTVKWHLTMCYASFYDDFNKGYNPSCLFMIKKKNKTKQSRKISAGMLAYLAKLQDSYTCSCCGVMIMRGRLMMAEGAM